jgi:hypothetical protein
VYYDYVASRSRLPAGRSPFPPLLVACCGEDFLHGIARIDLPAGAKSIEFAGLVSVETAVLHGDEVDDADLAAIARLPNLKHLKIMSHGQPGHHRGTKVTDRSLEVIGRIPTIESVCVESTSLSWRGIQDLLKAPQLKSLRVHGFDGSELKAIDFPAGVDVEFTEPRMQGVLWGGRPPEDESWHFHRGLEP